MGWWEYNRFISDLKITTNFVGLPVDKTQNVKYYIAQKINILWLSALIPIVTKKLSLTIRPLNWKITSMLSVTLHKK